MATVVTDPAVQQIGEMAGVVWQTLESEGPMTMAKLVRTIGAPRDVVSQGIGWLAREDKITFEERARGRVISLC